MAILAALNLMSAAFSHNGSKNQSSHLDNIIVGLVLVGLDLVVRTWSGRLYPAVIGALVVLVAASLVTIDLLINACAVFPLALLVLGRKRYMEAIPEVDLPQRSRRAT